MALSMTVVATTLYESSKCSHSYKLLEIILLSGLPMGGYPKPMMPVYYTLQYTIAYIKRGRDFVHTCSAPYHQRACKLGGMPIWGQNLLVYIEHHRSNCCQKGNWWRQTEYFLVKRVKDLQYQLASLVWRCHVHISPNDMIRCCIRVVLLFSKESYPFISYQINFTK